MTKLEPENRSGTPSKPTVVGAIGKEADRFMAEKLLVDQLSVALLMGNISDSALRLNSGAEAKKTTTQAQRKSSDTKWNQQLLWHLAQELDQIQRLIEAIEEKIEVLRLEAQAHREHALELFERADTLEDILADGLQDHERNQAITLLRQSGHDGNLGALPLGEIAALLTIQLQKDRDEAASSYQDGEDCDAEANALERELAIRKREAEELRRELESIDNDTLQADRLSEACLRLKDDLLAIAPDSSFAAAVREDVAIQKHHALTPEDYEFDAEEELSSLDLGSLTPPHNP